MLGYLEKFNKLPAAVRNQVSDARALAVIEALEKKYKVALAALIMKIMVGELAVNQLADNLLKENLSKAQAGELAKELTAKLFSPFPSTSLVTEENYFRAGAAKPAPALKSENQVRGANFFFSADDEEEIRQLTKKIATVENFGQPSGELDDKLKEIISRARINFGSADLADRFSQILKTYLRGIRNKLDVKATLMKPFLNGGLSFDEDSAEQVMLLADKILRPVKLLRTDQVGFNGVNSSPPAPVRDAAYDFSKLADRADKIKNDLKKLDTAHELAPLTPAVRPAPAALQAAAKAKEPSPASEKKPLPKNIQTAAAPVNRPLIKRRFKAENLSQAQKVKIEDVKYVPRVMGPLDELKYLDLISFHRLDKNPFNGAAKIKNKLDLLAEENYGKKLEGIKLWRLSPVNKLYLAIGRLSLSENKSVDVIIEERKMAGADYLTPDEFKAIMDLNKNLRF